MPVQLCAEHDAPSATVACLQPPRPSQLSMVHGLPSLHGFAATPHLPLLQKAPVLHCELSSHGLVLLLNEQPDLPSHVSVVHGFLSSHTSADPGAQWPPVHASLTVQTLPSSQGFPGLPGTCMQPCVGEQVSSVQTLSSLQFVAPPPTHTPNAHVSSAVHGLPSLHEARFA